MRAILWSFVLPLSCLIILPLLLVKINVRNSIFLEYTLLIIYNNVLEHMLMMVLTSNIYIFIQMLQREGSIVTRV